VRGMRQLERFYRHNSVGHAMVQGLGPALLVEEVSQGRLNGCRILCPVPVTDKRMREERACRVAPPSALPGISPTGGEIGWARWLPQTTKVL